MKLELFISAIVAFLLYNLYNDGKYSKIFMSYKKYFQMGIIVIVAISFYLMVRRNPGQTKNMLLCTNNMIKYLPIDKNTSNMLSPILDFTSKQNFYNNQYSSLDGGDFNYPVASMPQQGSHSHGHGGVAESRILQSGKKATKRSVSETKKKFVASRQNWKCGECQSQLNAWFEVDHIKRLEYGGSNHIDNLVALCRECHGKKTTIENL